MKEMRIGLHATAVSSLQFAQRLRLRIVRLDWKGFVDKKVPYFFAAFSGVERFELGITDSPVMVVGDGWLSSVTLTHQLDDSFALIDLLAQHRAQVASFRSEDVLPDRFVTQKGQRIGDKLPRAAELSTNRGNKN
jgi:hypothetical protein